MFKPSKMAASTGLVHRDSWVRFNGFARTFEEMPRDMGRIVENGQKCIIFR